MTTLQYIKKKTRRFQTFVANRVTEIQEATPPGQWHHVPGADNPYDGSINVSIEYFDPDCRWWTGPAFLCQHQDKWPNNQMEYLPEVNEEITKHPKCCSNHQRIANWTFTTPLFVLFLFTKSYVMGTEFRQMPKKSTRQAHLHLLNYSKQVNKLRNWFSVNRFVNNTSPYKEFNKLRATVH
jgi:hypothetical protein